MKQTGKLPYVAKARAFDFQQAQPIIDPTSVALAPPNEFGEHRSTYLLRGRNSYMFSSKQSFLEFVDAIALIPGFEPLKIVTEQDEILDGPMASQIERYFALSESNRRRLTLRTGLPTQQDSIRIMLGQGLDDTTQHAWNTVIEVQVSKSVQDAATNVGQKIHATLLVFTDPRPPRGKSAKASVVRPMDLHTLELEEFKTQQNKRTFRISTGIAIGGIVLSAIVQLLIKIVNQPVPPLPIP
ncbi:hypothetical protein [Arthrobacter glacialis]|uniref:hypothetical protein n=1 Tax=Arthrobacter glacialis TaxID=1664 RepID=UPI000D44D1C4|nr:hypothetical protein [Arthrobacter glacialis]POH58284.1 hypothetical protein CVS28_12640 [Arthrobacter glacialis]